MQVETSKSSPIFWAAYLGISWTWVIGMFLPVLLIRDYGIWSWVIFAIPNCVGAAAMGWVLRSADQSTRMVKTHAAACRLFSLVTIAFHIFFSIWIIPRLLGPAGWLVPAVLVQLAYTPGRRSGGMLRSAFVVFGISIGIAIVLGTMGKLAVPTAAPFSMGEIIGLSVVCVLGFLACPYLDLTFHRARQNTTDAGAKFAFDVGFCVFFASMIIFTLLYATSMFTLNQLSAAACLLAAHLSVQMVFTVIVHSRVLFAQAVKRDDDGNFRAMLSATLAAAMAAGLAAHFGFTEQLTFRGRELGEVIYRCFMSFYGLVFPAYAIISILSGRARWILSIIIIILALPFYWLAFIEAEMQWAITGGAIVVVGGVLSWMTRGAQITGTDLASATN